MNKSSLIKTILVIMLGMVLMFSTSVFAADADADAADIFFNDDEEDTSSSIIADDKQPSSTKAPSTSGTSTDGNKLEVENTPTPTNNTSNTPANNTSVYGNTNNTQNTTNTPNTISKAGLEDSLPTIVLIAVFAVSAVFAYKKINEYKNI